MQIRLSQFESLAASSKTGQVAVSRGESGDSQLHTVRGFGGRLLRLFQPRADTGQAQLSESLFHALAEKYGDALALRAMQKARRDFHTQPTSLSQTQAAKPLSMRELRIALEFVKATTYEAQVEQFRKPAKDYLPGSGMALLPLANRIGIDISSWSSLQRDYFRDQLQRITRYDQEEAFDLSKSPMRTGSKQAIEALASKCLRYVDQLGPSRIQNSQANWHEATQLGRRCLEQCTASQHKAKQPLDAALTLAALAQKLDLLVFDSRAEVAVVAEDDLLASRRQYLDQLVDAMSPFVANRLAKSLLNEAGTGQSLLVALGAQTAFTVSSSPSQFYAAKELGTLLCELIERVAKRGGVEVSGDGLMKKFYEANAVINPASPLSTIEEKSIQFHQSAKASATPLLKAPRTGIEYALQTSEAAVILRAQEVRRTWAIEANDNDTLSDSLIDKQLKYQGLTGTRVSSEQ